MIKEKSRSRLVMSQSVKRNFFFFQYSHQSTCRDSQSKIDSFLQQFLSANIEGVFSEKKERKNKQHFFFFSEKSLRRYV